MSLETLFSGTVIINRPIMEVFEYATDIDRLKDWFPYYATVEPSPPRNGAQTSFRASLGAKLGPRITVDLIDYVPGRRASYRCISLGLTCTTEFEPSSRGTILTTTMSLWGWQAVMFGLVAQPLRLLGNDLVAQSQMSLKRKVEARKVDVRPLVFFCYRREQAKYVGGRIYDALCQEFGTGYVFRDFESVSGGTQVQQRIQDALGRCKIIVAHIDDKWEDEIKSRVEKHTSDYVREEIETALQSDIRMIPVFTSSREDFSMRRRLESVRQKLPAGLIKDALHDRQGLLLRTDPDFNQDLEKLLQTVWPTIS